jgi:hypothetical protein
LIGRWIGYLLQGKFRHTDILQMPPLRGELLLGLAAHYSIGIVLTLMYLGLVGCGAPDADGTQRHPLRNGYHRLPLVSHVPITGDGLADAPGDAHLARISLFNHIMFGLGIALWMAVIRPI